jgi:biopolymer transport protein ExbD
MGAAPSQKSDEPITDINVTPLVDVSLVLVIIFMAIAPFAIQAGIKVLESRAKASVGKVSADDNVNVRLTKDGQATVNGKTVELSQIFKALSEALFASKDKMVIITADDENKVGQVVGVLDSAKQAGAAKLALMRNAAAAAAPTGAGGK